MNDPRIRLHDISIDGDDVDADAVLAAVERAVAQTTALGAISADAVRSAVAESVAGEVQR